MNYSVKTHNATPDKQSPLCFDLGQCAVDELKTRYSLLHSDQQDRQAIDFNDLSNYTLTHYVDNHQGPQITDDVIQLLIREAQQEGIVMRQVHDEDELDAMPAQSAESLLFTPAIDRPPSSSSTASHIGLSSRNLN
jgi:hypothetical protein